MKDILLLIHHSSFIIPHSSFSSPSPLINQRGDEARPAGLVRSAEAHACVAVEVFVEEKAVAPVRVGLKFFVPAVHGPSAFAVARQYPHENVGGAEAPPVETNGE